MFSWTCTVDNAVEYLYWTCERDHHLKFILPHTQTSMRLVFYRRDVVLSIFSLVYDYDLQGWLRIHWTIKYGHIYHRVCLGFLLVMCNLYTEQKCKIWNSLLHWQQWELKNFSTQFFNILIVGTCLWFCLWYLFWWYSVLV